MKCRNKIEKQKLNEADFVLKFYFLSQFFSVWGKERKLCLHSLLLCLFDFIYRYSLTLFLCFSLPSAWLQLNVKIWNNYFSISLSTAENNSSDGESICNLWIKSRPQKLRALRGVIEFHMFGLLLRTAPLMTTEKCGTIFRPNNRISISGSLG